MHIEFLVEEPSAEAALRNIVPKIVGKDATFDVHPFQGRDDLEKQLPKRLKGYSQWLPADWRIVILVDKDDDECHQLKNRLEAIARNANLITKSSVPAGAAFQVMNRLAIEELEAWFLGDVEAIRKAYPRISASLTHKAKYRNPDAVRGGTKEALHRELNRAGYHPSGVPPIDTARKISAHMDPERNMSKSFQVFRDGLRELIRMNGCSPLQSPR